MCPTLKHKGAIIAVAHALVYAIYHVLAFQRPYKPLAAISIGEGKAKRLIRHHQRRIKHLQAFLRSQPRPDMDYLLGRLEQTM